jgi:hypothetical protein
LPEMALAEMRLGVAHYVHNAKRHHQAINGEG